MKVLYLIVLLTVINLSSSQWFIGRRPLGTEPYIPYHHICTRSCWDSSDGSTDLRIKWSCCDRGWDKCCASSIIQTTNIEPLPNSYESLRLFDSSMQSNQNPLHPTHLDYSNSGLQSYPNPFYRIPIFQQNNLNSNLDQFAPQQNDDKSFKQTIISSPDTDRKNETISRIEFSSNKNLTSPQLSITNVNTSFIELEKISNNNTDSIAIV